MIQAKTTVLWNKKMGPDYYRIGLRCPPEYRQAIPGQFVMLQIGEGYGPLLRRPFSIHRLMGDGGNDTIIEILYKVIGVGTAKLSGTGEGNFIDLLGPLGNGFSVPVQKRRMMLVAGGIGVAPLLFLAETIHKKGVDTSGMSIFIGGRTNADLLCIDRFNALGLQVRTTTEDGSAGRKGLIIGPLVKGLQKSPPEVIFACGPRGMLAAVASLSIKYETPCQISVETTMACGMGACLGCAVIYDEKSGHYHHACLDGPVFDADKMKPFLSDF